MTSIDAIVIGGGVVGGALAFGLARQGLKVKVLDEGDIAYRASRGNAGVVWVQGKGYGCPEYQLWTRRSAEDWPNLAAELLDGTNLDVRLENRGGVVPYFSEEGRDKRQALMEQLRIEAGNAGFEYDMLDRRELARLVPGIGPKVFGASYTAYDGQVNPLNLLRTLHAAFLRLGGRYVSNARVTKIEAAPHAFTVRAGVETVTAPKLILAAGLGTVALAPSLGLSVPLEPQRGQVMITERVDQTLPLPVQGGIRQTHEGAFQLGGTAGNTGFDDRTTIQGLSQGASFAVDCLPYLAGVKVVRAWSALRIMSPDEFPIYEQSGEFPGAFVATCHSGVTLAAAHTYRLAKSIAGGALPEELARLSTRRFEKSAANQGQP
ncbi:MAG: FAD-binding oxidoreductase [Rhodospirillales bacterium]|nr:FAD-binding oxidoreductase [Rhodospirillales bacterium]